MARLRSIIRRLVLTAFLSAVAAITWGVFGEFFIEWARENGFYNNPSERLEAGMTAFSSFVTQFWFLIATAFLAGLVVGLWTDKILRRREAAGDPDAVLRSLPIGEPGQLDYIIEGLESLQDITRIFNEMARTVQRNTRMMARYEIILRFVQNFWWRRKIAARVASKLNKYSKTMNIYIPLIADVTKRAHVNCLAVIENTPIHSDAELMHLLGFAGALQGMAETSANAVIGIEQTVQVASFLFGISREMNASITLFTATLNGLGAETRSYGNVCNDLLKAANARAAAVAKMLSNPIEDQLLQSPPDTEQEIPP